MPETNIDRLQIEINAESNQAAKGIDKLVSSLERLSNATGGGISGVSRISNDLNVLNLSLTNMKGKGNNLTRITNSLSKLSTINLSGAIGNISQFV